MGKIIADIVIKGGEKEIFDRLHDMIFIYDGVVRQYFPENVDLTAKYFLCPSCKKQLAWVLTKTGEYGKGDEIHLIMNPCARVVLGIHPDEIKAIEKRLGGEQRTRDFSYYCAACRRLLLPEYIAEHGVYEIQNKLHLNPIVDMPEYIPGKGYWITMTEFPVVRDGRFMNLQVDHSAYAKIVTRIGGIRS